MKILFFKCNCVQKSSLLTKIEQKMPSECGIYCTCRYSNLTKQFDADFSISVRLFYEEIDNLHQCKKMSKVLASTDI